MPADAVDRYAPTTVVHRTQHEPVHSLGHRDFEQVRRNSDAEAHVATSPDAILDLLAPAAADDHRVAVIDRCVQCDVAVPGLAEHDLDPRRRLFGFFHRLFPPGVTVAQPQPGIGGRAVHRSFGHGVEEFAVLQGHGLDSDGAVNGLPRCPPHARDSLPVGRQRSQPCRHLVRRADGDDDAVFAVADPLVDAAGDTGDGGHDAGAHRFEHRDARALVVADQHAGVDVAQEPLDPLRAATSVYGDAAVAESSPIERLTPGGQAVAVADHVEVVLDGSGLEAVDDGQQVGDSFLGLDHAADVGELERTVVGHVARCGGDRDTVDDPGKRAVAGQGSEPLHAGGTDAHGAVPAVVELHHVAAHRVVRVGDRDDRHAVGPQLHRRRVAQVPVVG